MRVTFDRRDAFVGDHTTYLMRVRLVFGWDFDATITAYRRWRLAVIGGGIHLGEPWGEEGPLWSLNLRVYAFGVCLGFRGPAPTPPAIEPDEWDSEEAPNDRA